MGFFASGEYSTAFFCLYKEGILFVKKRTRIPLGEIRILQPFGNEGLLLILRFFNIFIFFQVQLIRVQKLVLELQIKDFIAVDFLHLWAILVA